jgi:uncharacterized YigZ family protein
MQTPTSYLIPSKPLRVEQEIKKSNFITYLRPISNIHEFKDFLSEIKKAYPDARHHCSAYLCGKPGQTTILGCSDDGEPSGTAGKPMLNILQHKNVGDIGVIVVRYFGGIKLGTGGLVRAYSSSVQQAYDSMITVIKANYTNRKLCFDYNLEPDIRHFLQERNIGVLESNYNAQVVFLIKIPEDLLEQYEIEIKNFTNNKVQLQETNTLNKN